MGGLTIKTKDFGGGQAAEQKQWTRHGPIESSYSVRSYYNNYTLDSTDLREGRGREAKLSGCPAHLVFEHGLGCGQ